jgi:hypothetical protein
MAVHPTGLPDAISQPSEVAALNAEQIIVRAVQHGFDGWRVAIALGVVPQQAAALLRAAGRSAGR